MSAEVLIASPPAIARALDVLRKGGIVATPTETVYGLAARASDARAVAKAFAAKGRPAFNPLIAHVVDGAMAVRLARFDARAQLAIDAFWPGPLTLVLPRRPDAPIADLAVAGLDTVAVRAPRHAVARELLAGLGEPVVMPSANPSGRLSPTRAVDVARELGDRIDLILDGGPTSYGVESTVVDLSGERPVLLRPGPITHEELARVLGPVELAATGEDAAPKSPGRAARHYAPERAQLRLGVAAPDPGEAYLGFGPTAWSDLNLSPGADLEEAAANLFPYLRALDAAGYRRIAVAPIPHEGLGAAITDRLARAAV